MCDQTCTAEVDQEECGRPATTTRDFDTVQMKITMAVCGEHAREWDYHNSTAFGR